MRGNARYRRRRGNEMGAARLAVVREPWDCVRRVRLANAPLDAGLLDTGQVPLLEEGGVGAFIARSSAGSGGNTVIQDSLQQEWATLPYETQPSI